MRTLLLSSAMVLSAFAASVEANDEPSTPRKAMEFIDGSINYTADIVAGSVRDYANNPFGFFLTSLVSSVFSTVYGPSGAIALSGQISFYSSAAYSSLGMTSQAIRPYDTIQALQDDAVAYLAQEDEGMSTYLEDFINLMRDEIQEFRELTDEQVAALIVIANAENQ